MENLDLEICRVLLDEESHSMYTSLRGLVHDIKDKHKYLFFVIEECSEEIILWFAQYSYEIYNHKKEIIDKPITLEIIKKGWKLLAQDGYLHWMSKMNFEHVLYIMQHELYDHINYDVPGKGFIYCNWIPYSQPFFMYYSIILYNKVVLKEIINYYSTKDQNDYHLFFSWLIIDGFTKGMFIPKEEHIIKYVQCCYVNYCKEYILNVVQYPEFVTKHKELLLKYKPDCWITGYYTFIWPEEYLIKHKEKYNIVLNELLYRPEGLGFLYAQNEFNHCLNNI
jgi:hypothetical protein